MSLVAPFYWNIDKHAKGASFFLLFDFLEVLRQHILGVVGMLHIIL